MNGYTFKGSNSFISIFASHLICGQLQTNLLPKKQILSFKSRPYRYFERVELSRKAKVVSFCNKNSAECYVAPALCPHIRNSMKANISSSGGKVDFGGLVIFSNSGHT